MTIGKMYFYRDKYAEKTRIRRIRLHDFRHSCASLLINKGANIQVIAKYLGHIKIEETLKNIHICIKIDLILLLILLNYKIAD